MGFNSLISPLFDVLLHFNDFFLPVMLFLKIFVLFSQLQQSKICQHDDCIMALNKDVYAPCNRSDLGQCIRTGKEVHDCTLALIYFFTYM